MSSDDKPCRILHGETFEETISRVQLVSSAGRNWVRERSEDRPARGQIKAPGQRKLWAGLTHVALIHEGVGVIGLKGKTCGVSDGEMGFLSPLTTLCLYQQTVCT